MSVKSVFVNHWMGDINCEGLKNLTGVDFAPNQKGAVIYVTDEELGRIAVTLSSSFDVCIKRDSHDYPMLWLDKQGWMFRQR